jgi:DNA topoisomerase-3
MGFVVERYKAIQSFCPEQFWKIKVTHEQDGCRVDFLWRRVRLFEEAAAQAVCEHCQDAPTARVEDCRSKPKQKWRPLPLETVELEKQASRKLRMTAKATMATAEKLYTAGLISYPRTETNIFPKELELAPLVEAQTADPRWGEFAGRVLAEGGPRPRAGKKSDQAHPPIHPLKAGGHLQGDEARVYEFIARHFLACVSQDALGKETTVSIDIAGEKFVGHGLTVLQRNYLEVYVYERWSDKEIIDYEHIQEFEPSSIELVGGSTEPPRLLTEADLIGLMDKHGIGTDATHAEHIETVKAREYVFVEDRDKLVPGKLAMALVDGYDAMGDWKMSKPMLRAGLEADLKLVCEGRKTKDEVLEEQVNRYREVFQETTARVAALDTATAHYLEEQPAGGAGAATEDGNEPVVQCAACGLQLALRRTATGKWMVSCQVSVGVSLRNALCNPPGVPWLHGGAGVAPEHGAGGEGGGGGLPALPPRPPHPVPGRGPRGAPSLLPGPWLRLPRRLRRLPP